MKLLFSLCLVLFTNLLLAQDTIEVISKFDKDHIEVFNVLKSDMKTREGIYQMRYKKKIAIASGAYKNNQRVGKWHFFDNKAKLLQTFNYDNQLVTYEAPESTTVKPYFNYRVDVPFDQKDTVLKPIKIGGRYYGYLPLLKLFQRPMDVSLNGDSQIPAVVELLVSPGGNLADYTIHIDGLNLNVDLNLLSEEEKRFVPARKNGEPVSCRIIIPCKMVSGGRLMLMTDADMRR